MTLLILPLPMQRLTRVYSAQGTIQFSYAYVDRPSGPSDVFHTRLMTYPVNVTVYHTLECSNLDIIPFKNYTNLPHLNTLATTDDQDRVTLLSIDSDDSYCLVSVDVINLYGSPFQVSLERHQDGMNIFHCHRNQVT